MRYYIDHGLLLKTHCMLSSRSLFIFFLSWVWLMYTSFTRHILKYTQYWAICGMHCSECYLRHRHYTTSIWPKYLSLPHYKGKYFKIPEQKSTTELLETKYNTIWNQEVKERLCVTKYLSLFKQMSSYITKYLVFYLIISNINTTD